jgi:hypothetical protein
LYNAQRQNQLQQQRAAQQQQLWISIIIIILFICKKRKITQKAFLCAVVCTKTKNNIKR